MSLILRLAGVGVICVGSVMVLREYSAYLNRRIMHFESILCLLELLWENKSNLAKDRFEIWRKFRNDVLEECGFLPALRRGDRIADAFEERMQNFAIGEQWRERILSVLREINMVDFRDNLSDLIDEIKKECDQEVNSKENNIKVARALLIGGVLAVGIMII